MSWWNTLAKIGLGVAAPFTGGGSLGGIPLLSGGGQTNSGQQPSILDTVGQIASGLGAGRQKGRESDATFQQKQDQNAIAAANTNLGAGQQRASQSVRGDYLANAQDFHWGAPTMVGNIPVPSSTGGFRPSMFSDNTRKLGAQLSSDALRDQTTNGGRAVSLTPLPESGAVDSILNTVGSIAPFLSQLPYKKKPQPVPPVAPTPWTSDRLNGMGL